jgi:hypothetical protein
MATKRQAELAARKLKRGLVKRGAFAMDVRKLPRATGFAVYAFFEKKPRPKLPDTAEVEDKGKQVRVPVRIVVSDVFKPD